MKRWLRLTFRTWTRLWMRCYAILTLYCRSMWYFHFSCWMQSNSSLWCHKRHSDASIQLWLCILVHKLSRVHDAGLAGISIELRNFHRDRIQPCHMLSRRIYHQPTRVCDGPAQLIELTVPQLAKFDKHITWNWKLRCYVFNNTTWHTKWYCMQNAESRNLALASQCFPIECVTYKKTSDVGKFRINSKQTDSYILRYPDIGAHLCGTCT